MAVKLFTTRDREESHRKLEEVLREGRFPAAECREADAEGNYTVWSGPEAGRAPELEPVVAPGRMHPDDLKALAELLRKA